MDYTSIAIAGKLKELFEDPNVFLSFPLGKVAFSYRALDFMKSESSTGISEIEKLNNRANFSRIVNIIPRDHILFEMDASQFLWDEYEYSMRHAIFARSSLNAQEQFQLDEAIRFLGDKKLSSALKNYQLYRARFDVANRQYFEKKLSVELSTGAERDRLQKVWDTYLEKELRDAKERAENDWINHGHKFEVEKYQSVRNTLEAKKYESSEKYLNDLELSEFLDTNGAGASVYSTVYGPQNAFDRDVVWTELTVTSSEIQSYVEKASDDVKSLFASEVGTDLGNLESISLEYNNVSIIRPWFHSQFFEMRNWRIPDETIISDGGIPRRGRIPAYISSMLMIKNVRYQYRSMPKSPNREVLAILGARPLAKIIKEIKIPNLNEIPIGGLRGPDVDPPPDLDWVRPRGPIEEIPVVSRRDARMRPIGDVTNGPVLRPEVGNSDHIGTNGSRVLSVTSESYPFDEGIYVTAFVCRRIPKSPNPDLNLIW